MEYVAELIPLGPLGAGAFGEVHRLRDQVHGDVAAKHFFKSKFGTEATWNDDCEKAWNQACEKGLGEAKNLKALEHSNVVRIHQVYRQPATDAFVIVMEFCERGSVRQVTASDEVSLPEAKRIARDAAMGLNYIHNNEFLHRDIKPDNILLKADGHVKVGDFGFVTDDLQFGFATPYGSPVYWAPEVLVDKACSSVSDVFSLGATFINLLSGDHWFFADRRGGMVKTDDDGEPFLSPSMLYLPHVPAAWRSLANKMVRPDPSRRCQSLDEAVNSLSKLPPVENWQCVVKEDSISWTLDKGKRRVRVQWDSYLGRANESWVAWSEDLGGGAKKTLGKSVKSDKWRAKYASLQDFFAKRSL